MTGGDRDGGTMGNDGASPHTPAGNIVPCTLSPLRGGLKKVGEGWIAMQSIEGRMGVSPAGTLVPQTPNFDSLRFEIRKNRWIAKQSIQVESPENSVFWRVLGQSPNVTPT